MSDDATKTVDLSQTYTFGGTHYGPGAGVTVPGDFPDVSKQEAAFKAAAAERAKPAGEVMLPASMDTLAEVATGEPSTVPDKKPLGTTGGAGSTVSGKSEADLQDMTKDELVALAEEQGIEVTRADGDGEPLKADYVAALSASA